MNRDPDKQYVNVKIDMTVELDKKYKGKELASMVERNAIRAFPCNSRTLHSVAFKPEGKARIKIKIS